MVVNRIDLLRSINLDRQQGKTRNHFRSVFCVLFVLFLPATVNVVNQCPSLVGQRARLRPGGDEGSKFQLTTVLASQELQL